MANAYDEVIREIAKSEAGRNAEYLQEHKRWDLFKEQEYFNRRIPELQGILGTAFKIIERHGYEVKRSPITRIVEEAREKKPTCNFCGHENDHPLVDLLIAAEDKTAICDRCIGLCIELIKERDYKIITDLKKENSNLKSELESIKKIGQQEL